jgi:hypothetical protein
MCMPQALTMLAAVLQAKAVGSDPLGDHIRRLQPDLHLFGHSHFSWDATVHGVRCLQAPLCYPAERSLRMKTIRLTSLDPNDANDDWSTPQWDMPSLPDEAGPITPHASLASHHENKAYEYL